MLLSTHGSKGIDTRLPIDSDWTELNLSGVEKFTSNPAKVVFYRLIITSFSTHSTLSYVPAERQASEKEL